MAQTREGAVKIAAKKAGISVEEYRQRMEHGLKKCSTCKQWKTTDSFTKDNSRFDGLKSRCRECDYNAITDKPGNRERKLMFEKGLRWCCKCQTWLAIELITKNGSCRPHEAETARIRYATNELVRRERRQHSYSRKRRCQPISPQVQIQVLKEFDGVCAYCTSPATTFDHVVPITKGGTSELTNIVTACASCNASKNNKDVIVWVRATNKTISQAMAKRLKLR